MVDDLVGAGLAASRRIDQYTSIWHRPCNAGGWVVRALVIWRPARSGDVRPNRREKSSMGTDQGHAAAVTNTHWSKRR